MIVTALENFLLFNTVLTTIGVMVAWAARRASRGQPGRLAPPTLARLYTLVLVVPPLTAGWVVAASLLPSSWLDERAFQAAHGGSLHDMHLVGNLTAELEPHLGYGLLLVVAGTAVLVAWSTARSHRRLAWAVARLHLRGTLPPADQVSVVEAVAARHAVDVGLLHTDHPVSFVWGWRRPKLVLSSGLLAALTPAELAAVLEHEAAHCARRDNLIKLALTVCVHASLAAPLGRRVLRWRSEQVEVLCDEVAAARAAAPLDVAAALVKLSRRVQSSSGAPAMISAAASSFVPDERSVERRVRHLLGLAEGPREALRVAKAPRVGTVCLVATVFVLSLAGLNTWAPLAVHTATEALLQLLR